MPFLPTATGGVRLMTAEQADEILLIGTPRAPDARTLAEVMGDLDAALSRVQEFRAAVARLPGDHELTVIRLDYMAGSLREAIEDGDRALGSWKAGS